MTAQSSGPASAVDSVDALPVSNWAVQEQTVRAQPQTPAGGSIFVRQTGLNEDSKITLARVAADAAGRRAMKGNRGGASAADEAECRGSDVQPSKNRPLPHNNDRRGRAMQARQVHKTGT